jgi:hypothetical protein
MRCWTWDVGGGQVCRPMAGLRHSGLRACPVASPAGPISAHPLSLEDAGIDRSVIEQLGYSMGLWNGQEAWLAMEGMILPHG